MHMKQCEDKPAAGAGNEAFGSVASLHQVGAYNGLSVLAVKYRCVVFLFLP